MTMKEYIYSHLKNGYSEKRLREDFDTLIAAAQTQIKQEIEQEIEQELEKGRQAKIDKARQDLINATSRYAALLTNNKGLKGLNEFEKQVQGLERIVNKALKGENCYKSMPTDVQILKDFLNNL